LDGQTYYLFQDKPGLKINTTNPISFLVDSEAISLRKAKKQYELTPEL
jgi:hypothetical protein